MTARFKAAAELTQAFAQHDHSVGAPLIAYRVGIVHEVFTLHEQATFAEPAAFEPTSLVGNSGGACYMLVQQSSRKLWTIVSYVPETSGVKDRTLYASGRDSLKRELGATHFYPRDIHCTEPNELAAACFVEDAMEARRKEYQGNASMDATTSGALLGEALSAHPVGSGLAHRMRGVTLMESERVAQSEQRTAATASVGALGALMAGGSVRPTGAAVSFPATDAAKEALRALGGAERGGLLITVKAEHLDVDAHLDDGSASALRAALSARDGAEPVFALLRYVSRAPAAEGAPASALVLVSFCPEGCVVRVRMIHASAKPALRSLLSELQLEVLKSVETQDLDDLTDEWLAERVEQPAAGAADGEVLRRPAPKGGRRVLRRPDE